VHFGRTLAGRELAQKALTAPIWQFNYVIVPRDYVPNSNPGVTLRVYSHVTPTMQREAAQVMDAALSGPA
jgi:hypothetical protein